MTSRISRHLELLALSKSLGRYAASLQADVNASRLLVHHTLSRAFAESGKTLRPTAGLSASLRADLQHSFEATDAGV